MIAQFIKGLIELWVERKPEPERSPFEQWLYSKRPGTRAPWDLGIKTETDTTTDLNQRMMTTIDEAI